MVMGYERIKNNVQTVTGMQPNQLKTIINPAGYSWIISEAIKILAQEREEILINAKVFFLDTIAKNHVINTKKLKNLKEFKINPFLIFYLSNYLTGNNNPRSIAKALVYPRVLGTSITTSFGTNIQYFCSTVLGGFATAIQGLDIEFDDHVDGCRKYCQIKSGPETINKDDIVTIIGHFNAVRNLARTNRLQIGFNDLIVGVLYGTEQELSQHYRVINQDYPVIVGQEFWYRLTGSETFYFELINAFGEVARNINGVDLLEDVIQQLTREIETSNLFSST